MPKGTLVFDLPEESVEFKEAQEGPEWKVLTIDILSHLRNEIKYNEKMSDEKKAAYEEVRELIWNSIEERKLKAD